MSTRAWLRNSVLRKKRPLGTLEENRLLTTGIGWTGFGLKADKENIQQEDSLAKPTKMIKRQKREKVENASLSKWTPPRFAFKPTKEKVG